MKVRLAGSADREAVWPLVRDFATSFEPERGQFDASFDALVTAPHTLLAVAQTLAQTPVQMPAPAVVGYVLANSHLTLFANRPVVWVEEIMVRSSSRRSGVGRDLMGYVQRWAIEINAAYVGLATRRADAFYAALGFERSAQLYRKLTPGS